MKPIRIAILGYGKIAHDQHVPSIQGNKRFELVATSSRSGQGVGQTFADWRELIRGVQGLQAVAITTPPEPRFEIARECILAGLHCLLEKPPTVGLAEIAALDCLAQAQGVSLFTTWHAQHHSSVDAAARALAGKRIFEICKADPDFRETFLERAMLDPIAGSPDQFAEFIKAEAAKWSKVVKEANLRVE